MNKPTDTDYVIGHGLAVALLACVTWATALGWLAAPQHPPALSWLVPVVSLAITGKAIKARRRVRAFAQWKRAWNEMEGGAPAQDAAPIVRARTSWKVLLIGLWCVLLVWMLTDSNPKVTNGYALGASVFLLLTAWGGLLLLLRLGRRTLRRSPTAASGVHVVSICIARPRSSPTAAAITAALPAHCKKLLFGSRSVPGHAGAPSS
jgi:hypothetical protein